MFPLKRLSGTFVSLWDAQVNDTCICTSIMPQNVFSINFGICQTVTKDATSDDSLFRRKMVDERTRQISDKSAEKARQESDRMDSKKQSSEKICQKERERQEKAETWKHSRIEAMRERRTQHEEMENSYERAAQEQESQRLVRVHQTLPGKEMEIPRADATSKQISLGFLSVLPAKGSLPHFLNANLPKL